MPNYRTREYLTPDEVVRYTEMSATRLRDFWRDVRGQDRAHLGRRHGERGRGPEVALRKVI
jgi:hypothetical protein